MPRESKKCEVSVFFLKSDEASLHFLLAYCYTNYLQHKNICSEYANDLCKNLQVKTGVLSKFSHILTPPNSFLLSSNVLWSVLRSNLEAVCILGCNFVIRKTRRVRLRERWIVPLCEEFCLVEGVGLANLGGHSFIHWSVSPWVWGIRKYEERMEKKF